MTDSAESRRRGCPFINLSKEDVPPYACMMMVAPPDKRTKGNDAVNSLQWKSSGVRGFGFEVDNEYGVYIDKCNTLGMLMQDPYRFVFNTDVTVPPGGTGYCSFGEFPVRANLKQGMVPYSTNYWDSCFYGPIENEWHVQALNTVGAYKFYGKVQARSLMVWLVPNITLARNYNIRGSFECSGINNASLSVLDDSSSRGVEDSIFFERLFGYPSGALSFSTPMTLKAPGVYAFYYRGTANVLNPDPSDTTIPFRFETYDGTTALSTSEKRGEGILNRVSNGYSTYWPSADFSGVIRVLVGDNPVELQLKQVLSEKVEAEGEWWAMYDREASSVNFGYGSLLLGDRWWLWE